MLLVLILLCYLSLLSSVESSNNSCLTTNWDSYIIGDLLNENDSVDIIRNIPIVIYFDVYKGNYRTGIIDSNIEKLNPDLIIKVDRKITKRTIPVMIEVNIIDASKFYMHFILTLKVVNNIIENLEKQVNFLLYNITQFHEKVINLTSLINFNDNNTHIWYHSNNIIEEINIIKLQLSILQLQSNYNAQQWYIQNQTRITINRLQYTSQDTLHTHILQHIQTHEENIYNIEHERICALDILYHTYIQKEHTFLSKQIQTEHSIEYNKLNNSINNMLYTIQQRIEYEAKVEREQEGYRLGKA